MIDSDIYWQIVTDEGQTCFSCSPWYILDCVDLNSTLSVTINLVLWNLNVPRTINTQSQIPFCWSGSSWQLGIAKMGWICDSGFDTILSRRVGSIYWRSTLLAKWGESAMLLILHIVFVSLLCCSLLFEWRHPVHHTFQMATFFLLVSVLLCLFCSFCLFSCLFSLSNSQPWLLPISAQPSVSLLRQRRLQLSVGCVRRPDPVKALPSPAKALVMFCLGVWFPSDWRSLPGDIILAFSTTVSLLHGGIAESFPTSCRKEPS